jgi:hypothetical protein
MKKISEEISNKNLFLKTFYKLQKLSKNSVEVEGVK